MKVSQSQAPMLLAVILDGSDQGDGTRVPERRCGFCRAFVVRFETSPGLRRRADVPELLEACTNAGGGILPCPGALRAKPMLDALKGATR